MEKEHFLIGKSRISGEVTPQGSKNAALPLIAACVESRGKYVLKNVPEIDDVYTLLKIFSYYGVKYKFDRNILSIDSTVITSPKEKIEESKKLRASSYLIGAILPSLKQLSLNYPGGCKLGERPLDIHFEVCKSLGIETIDGEELYFERTKEGKNVVALRFPSVGATINAILLSASSEREIIVENAAPEPEVDEVISFYKKTGVIIERVGRDIRIRGKENKKEIFHVVPFDRVVCGDYILLAAATGGELLIKGVDFRQEKAMISKLSQTSCQFRCFRDTIYIRSSGKLFGGVTTAPYPLFPTDLQAQFAAACVGSGGACRIKEHVFGSRFAYFEELKKMGVSGELKGDELILFPSRLKGGEVFAKDLRSGMALVIAGFCAREYTKVYDLRFIDRGYQNLVEVLNSINGDIKRIK